MDLQKIKEDNIVVLTHSKIVNFFKNYTQDEINDTLISFIDILEKYGNVNSYKENKPSLNTCEYNKVEIQPINDSITINSYILQEINKEYQEVLKNRDVLVGILKENNKQSINLIDTMKMPYLEKYMGDMGLNLNVQLVNQFKCELCNYYVCNTKKALSSHQRGCKKYVGSL
jgi:hypothetical protein